MAHPGIKRSPHVLVSLVALLQVCALMMGAYLTLAFWEGPWRVAHAYIALLPVLHGTNAGVLLLYRNLSLSSVRVPLAVSNIAWAFLALRVHRGLVGAWDVTTRSLLFDTCEIVLPIVTAATLLLLLVPAPRDAKSSEAYSNG